MYIDQLENLDLLIAERKTRQNEISQAVDAWVEMEYGISNFTKITDEYFGNAADNRARLVLCRQIPSVRTEDIACYIGSRLLGYNLLSLSFLDDSFSCDNHEKKSYLHIPWATHGRKNNLYFDHKRIIDGLLSNQTGKPLSSIAIKSDMAVNLLYEYHFRMRKDLFAETSPVLDVSDLHRIYLKEAKIKPASAFVLNQNGVSVRKQIEDGEEIVRPGSEWYYPIFYLWFLTGKMVMLETYDNPLAQVSEAKKLFEKTMIKIEQAIGLKPLVLKVPPLDERMLAFPKKVVENPSILNDIYQKNIQKNTGDSVLFFREIADTILTFA